MRCHRCNSDRTINRQCGAFTSAASHNTPSVLSRSTASKVLHASATSLLSRFQGMPRSKADITAVMTPLVKLLPARSAMEPLRDWFCRGADMTSAAECEAALVQLEEDPPDFRQYNVNIQEERWTNFSLQGVRFPSITFHVIQRGEALAIFERDLIIHFQQISRAAALYVRALLGGVKRTLEIYRRSGRFHKELSLVNTDH